MSPLHGSSEKIPGILPVKNSLDRVSRTFFLGISLFAMADITHKFGFPFSFRMPTIATDVPDNGRLKRVEEAITSSFGSGR